MQALLRVARPVRVTALRGVLGGVLAAACTKGAGHLEREAATVAVIREAFLSPRDTLDNVDSPAIWHGPAGEHWILSTAKSTDVLLVHDAATGRPFAESPGPARDPPA